VSTSGYQFTTGDAVGTPLGKLDGETDGTDVGVAVVGRPVGGTLIDGEADGTPVGLNVGGYVAVSLA
jgi:hypothetical protein